MLTVCSVAYQVKPRCRTSSGAGHGAHRHPVRTFSTGSRARLRHAERLPAHVTTAASCAESRERSSGTQAGPGTVGIVGLCSLPGRGSASFSRPRTASAPLSLGASRHSRKPLRRAGPNLLPVVHVRNDLDSAPGRADCADGISQQDAGRRGRVTAGQPYRTSKLAPVGFGEVCSPNPGRRLWVSSRTRGERCASLRDGLRPLFTEPVRRGAAVHPTCNIQRQ